MARELFSANYFLASLRLHYMAGRMAANDPLSEASTLVLETHALLDADKRPLQDIANATDLPFYWLKSFKEEPRANASATRVQILWEFLTGRTLKV